jgi:hypothetical protein
MRQSDCVPVPNPRQFLWRFCHVDRRPKPSLSGFFGVVVCHQCSDYRYCAARDWDRYEPRKPGLVFVPTNDEPFPKCSQLEGPGHLLRTLADRVWVGFGFPGPVSTPLVHCRWRIGQSVPAENRYLVGKKPPKPATPAVLGKGDRPGPRNEQRWPRCLAASPWERRGQ